MYARVFMSLILLTRGLLSTRVRMTEYYGADIESKHKIELKPFHIAASLDDIIIIAAPIINISAQYFLMKPNSDTMKLNLSISRDMFDNKNISTNDEYNDIIVKYVKGNLKGIITPVNKYKIFNINYASKFTDTRDTFKDKEESLMGNEFMIGPLGEEDHGNWILSVYYKENDEWFELFQVITVEIIESIPTYPEKPKLNEGDHFKLRLAYPVKNLQSCEVTAPRTTFDRFYDRDRNNIDSCGFSIPNVTKNDEGLWRIIAVANIVYEANVFLKVNK